MKSRWPLWFGADIGWLNTFWNQHVFLKDERKQMFFQSDIKCVFCDSAETELFSLFGQTLLGSQYYCNNCKSIFEVVRFDDDDEDDDEA